MRENMYVHGKVLYVESEVYKYKGGENMWDGTVRGTRESAIYRRERKRGKEREEEKEGKKGKERKEKGIYAHAACSSSSI
jgi:hypothetical protein